MWTIIQGRCNKVLGSIYTLAELVHSLLSPLPPHKHDLKFGQRTKKSTVSQYVKTLGSTTKDKKGNPFYVFQDLTQDKSASAKEMMGEYEEKPAFLQHDHDVQLDLKAIAHQFYLGDIGTGMLYYTLAQVWWMLPTNEIVSCVLY
jgi:hypothetical protein